MSMSLKHKQVHIRSATVIDAERIAAVQIAAWQVAYKDIMPQKFLASLNLFKRIKQWQIILSNSVTKVLIAEINHDCVGFISLDRSNIANAEITAFYVLPTHWHEGIGTQLLHTICFQLLIKKFKTLTLWVMSKNQSAINFYQKNLFKITGNKRITEYDEELFVEGLQYQLSLLQVVFIALQKQHLNMLLKWLYKPHVQQFWPNKCSHETLLAKYTARLDESGYVRCYIIELHGKPIGFIQYCQSWREGNGWWPGAQTGTYSIDLFIAMEELLSLGLGTAIIKQFISEKIPPDYSEILIDVDPLNIAAIRCYEKAGFSYSHQMMTPEGTAIIMRYAKPS